MAYTYSLADTRTTTTIESDSLLDILLDMSEHNYTTTDYTLLEATKGLKGRHLHLDTPDQGTNLCVEETHYYKPDNVSFIIVLQVVDSGHLRVYYRERKLDHPLDARVNYMYKRLLNKLADKGDTV